MHSPNKRLDQRQAFFLYTATIKVMDALVVVGAWYLCWFLRFDLKVLPVFLDIPEFEMYSAASPFLALIFVATFHVVGAYRSDRIHFGFRSLRKVVQGSLLSTLVFVATVYFQGAILYSRAYLMLFAVLVTLLLCIERLLLHQLWRRAKMFLIRPIRTLLVGNGDLLELYLANMAARRPYPMNCFGRLGSVEAPPRIGKIPRLGDESALKEILDRERVDQVILSYPTSANQSYHELLELLSNELVSVKVIPDYGRHSTFTYAADHEVGVPLLHFNREPVGFSDRFLKRTFDILLSSILLVLLSPLLAVIAIAIRLGSRGPVIYSQERVGADGKHFTCYKFRTMRPDAEASSGPVWARADDDRTTPFGRWLRRTSLDELPQFFNILVGDMSLVGPRPERPNFVAQFREEIPKYMLRHRMKSGITGWAQINGLRANTSLTKRIQFDLYYIGHWSHLFDIKIILLTPWVLIRDYLKKNAY